jgi:hypothetical protein
MPAALLLAAALGLASCTRPLAPGEDAFAAALFGDTLDRAAVRVTRDFGIAPLPPPRPRGQARPLAGLPPDPCRRVPSPGRGEVAAFVLGNRIHLMGPVYDADVMAGWPERLSVGPALVFAHELVHVWQWQNRAITGYRPLRGAAESLRIADPYVYPFDPARPFLSYGFEQQAAIVEDWLCHVLLDPEAPRAAELRAVIAPVLPVEGVEAALGRSSPARPASGR